MPRLTPDWPGTFPVAVKRLTRRETKARLRTRRKDGHAGVRLLLELGGMGPVMPLTMAWIDSLSVWTDKAPLSGHLGTHLRVSVGAVAVGITEVIERIGVNGSGISLLTTFSR